MRHTHHRETFFPTEFMCGLDSTQGYLEFAGAPPDNTVELWFRKGDEHDFTTHLYRLRQLEREKLIEVVWRNETKEGIEYQTIAQKCLTTAGKSLLEELRTKSNRGRLIVQVRQMLWAVLTSVITTVVVLKVNG